MCRHYQRRSLSRSKPERLSIRVGINAGEPIGEDDDLYGRFVIDAERTPASANGGQLVVMDVAR